MIGEYGRSAVRQRKALRWVLLVLIGFCGVLILVKVTPGIDSLVPFPIQTVQIYGSSFMSKKAVLQLIRLDANRSMLTFSTTRAKKALLGDGRVAGVEIVKLFPDTLRIYVVEKERKLLLEVGGKSYWLARDGTVLCEDRPVLSGEGGPYITLISNSDDIKVGDKTGNFLLEKMISALVAIEKEHPAFYSVIRDASITGEGVRLRFRDGRYEVYLGNAVTKEKLEQLRALLLVLNTTDPAARGKESVFEIDMSFSQAAVRKRE